MKKTLILMSFIIMTSMVYAQVRITGTVTSSDDGSPLPGVNVLVQGTTTGTTTNTDGEYEISVPEGATLVFSFVGYETRETQLSPGQSSLDVVLQIRTEALDEIVVVGYGTQKRSDITGSVASISKEVLETRQGINVEQMLQGSMAGLSLTVSGTDVEGSQNVLLIRGQNSITASNTPLIILDGIPYSGALSEINPRDIESIEILKDASSSAIYGSRGSNGVILITSKKGRTGPVEVSYYFIGSLDQIINVPELMDGKTFYEAKINRGTGIATTVTEDEGYAAGRSTDWVDLATQTGKSQQHNLSFRGGNEMTKFYFSVDYTDVTGVAIGDDYQRVTGRLNLDNKIAWVTLSTSTQYGVYDRSGRESSFLDSFRKNPLGIPYEEDGSLKLEVWEHNVQNRNPMEYLNHDNNEVSSRIVTNNFLLLDFPFLQGLSFKFNTGYDYSTDLYQNYQGRNTRNGFSSKGILDYRDTKNTEWTIENILSFRRVFGKHSVFLTGLYSTNSEMRIQNSIDASGFPNDVLSYYQASLGESVIPSASYRKGSRISQMFRANYVFDSRYLLTATMRRDGYSAFGSERKFGVFSSFALGWNISNESFFQDVQFVENLKLRLSYGSNGNDAISPYATLPSLSEENYVSHESTTLFGFLPGKLGDPTLGWEQTNSFNIGLDFALFRNRIVGQFDTYWSRTTDLLLNKTISAINGSTSILQNIGETANKGTELQITSVNVHRGDFIWKTDFNISGYNTRIIHVGLTDDAGNYIDDIGSKWFIDESVKVYYDYEFDGIWQQDESDTPQGDVTAGSIRVMDYNGDGVITPEDRHIIGSRIPDFIAGLTNSFSFRNWNFSFFLNCVFGLKKPNELLDTGDLDYNHNRYNVNFWTVENPQNEYPMNNSGSIVNEYGIDFYENASFLRLQDIYLSYKLPVTNMMGIQKLEVFSSVRNIATFANWTGGTPEFSSQEAVPQKRSFKLGVNITF